MKIGLNFWLCRRLFFVILMLFMSVSLACADRFSFDQFYGLVLDYLGADRE